MSILQRFPVKLEYDASQERNLGSKDKAGETLWLQEKTKYWMKPESKAFVKPKQAVWVTYEISLTNEVQIQDHLNCSGQMLKGLSKTDDCIEKNEIIRPELRDFQEIQASLFPFRRLLVSA